MGVKYRLSFCNEDETPLRLDIEDSSYSGAILPIEGGANPFILSMLNNDEFAKLGTIRATEAQMEISSSDTFNIDLLADNSETKLKVNFYFNNVLEWTGFILPEFYQETISEHKILNITATDRLGILKDVAFPENYANMSLLDIVKTCLLKTGLSLNIVTLIGYNAIGKSLNNRPLEIQVIGERLFNQNGDVLNCYDVLMSVLDTFNCFITQFRGKWHIINKQQLETGLGSVIEYNSTIADNTIVSNTSFSRGVYLLDEIDTGGERNLRPVLSEVGILGEFGGSILYPKNNNFRNWTGIEFIDWTSHNGFVQGTYYDNPETYNETTGKINSFLPGLTNKLNNNNTFPASGNPVNMNTQKYLQSAPIPIVVDSIQDGKINIEYSFNITSRNRSATLFTIILETPNASKKYFLLNGSQGVFEHAGNNFSDLDHRTEGFNLMFNIAAGVARVISGEISVDGDTRFTTAVQTTISGSAIINGDIVDPLQFSDCKLYVRIYNVIDYINIATPSTIQSVVHNVNINIKSSRTLPKGNLYQATRNGNFTAKAEIKTSVFSDYLVRGLNGYFYSYPSDDSSIIQTNAFWTTNYDSNALPVLQHSVRQISRMYANMHSDYIVSINEPRINILDLISIACKSQSFVVSNYSIDYLRSKINLTASQITSATNPENEYIYSYFGKEGGTNVSSLSGVGSGAGNNSSGSGSQNLQQVLDRGNEGDKMRITESLVIPIQAPEEDDLEDGSIYIDEESVNPEDVGFDLEDLANVDITTRTDGYVVCWDATAGKYKLKSAGGGGGSQNLDSVLAQGNSSDRSGGILLSGNGEGYGYRLKFGAEIYGSPTLQRIYFKASDGYYLASFTPASKQMLVINPDSSISYEAIPGGGSGSQNLQQVLDEGNEGDKMRITESLVIPNQAPEEEDLEDGSIYIDEESVNPADVGFDLEDLANVDITTKTDGYVVYWDAAAGKYKLKSSGGGGGGSTAWVDITGKPTTLAGYGITDAMSTSHPANVIAGSDITDWDSAYTLSHTHSNKANLDTINQNLSTTSSVQFSEGVFSTRLRIPTSAPSSPQNGDLYLDADSVDAESVSGKFEDLTDVDIAARADGFVSYWDAATSKIKFKAPSSGGGAQYSNFVGITGSTDTLNATRANCHIVGTNSSGITITVAEASSMMPVRYRQNGVGKITFVADSGITLLVPPGKTARTRGDNSIVELFYETSTRVIIFGDLDS
jgi:hypothetical protein